MMEARVGIEPTHKGFADLSLTTWVPRLGVGQSSSALWFVRSAEALFWTEANEAGAGDRGRTGDIFLGKEALYH